MRRRAVATQSAPVEPPRASRSAVARQGDPIGIVCSMNFKPEEWGALSREIDAASSLIRHGFAILGGCC
jgi:hypothetical protein